MATGWALFPFFDVGFTEPMLMGMRRRDHLRSERRPAADHRSLAELGRWRLRRRSWGLWDDGWGADCARARWCCSLRMGWKAVDPDVPPPTVRRVMRVVVPVRVVITILARVVSPLAAVLVPQALAALGLDTRLTSWPDGYRPVHRRAKAFGWQAWAYGLPLWVWRRRWLPWLGGLDRL